MVDVDANERSIMEPWKPEQTGVNENALQAAVTVCAHLLLQLIIPNEHVHHLARSHMGSYLDSDTVTDYVSGLVLTLSGADETGSLQHSAAPPMPTAGPDPLTNRNRHSPATVAAVLDALANGCWKLPVPGDAS